MTDTIYSWVKDLPVIDWHNHLDIRTLAEDKPFGSLYEVWVKADPYKHRAMRICGEPERLITGEAPEDEKMAAWERTLPKLVGNPLFAWSQMELDFLKANPLETLTPLKLLRAFNVAYASPCVTADQVQELSLLGQRASCPLGGPADALGQRASCPLGSEPRPPLSWSPAEVREFPCTCAETEGHYSPTLSAGTVHRRNYPHIEQNSTFVCVTFRLADSLPAAQLAELEEIKREWVKCHPEPWDDATRSEWQAKIYDKVDKWLDAGHGECILADERCRRIVEEALEYFDANREDARNGQDARCPSAGGANGQDARCPSGGAANGQDARCPSGGGANGQDARCPSEGGQTGPTGILPVGHSRYRLHSYVVMPNHVHALFVLFEGANLAKILHSWKSYTAKRLNALLGREGKVWRDEYFDRLIRNADHYENVVRYFRKNAAVAQTLARLHGCTRNGQDARCPSAGDANGQDARCPSGGVANGQDARCPSGGGANGQDARCPSAGDANGQDARCPSAGGQTGPTGILPVGAGGVPRIVPSLRVNVGDVVDESTLRRFHEAGCRVVDVSVDDEDRLERDFASLAVIAGFAAAHGWTMLLHLGALRATSDRLRAVAGPAGGFAGMRAPVDPGKVARFLNRLEGIRNGQDARCPSGGAANGQDARCPSGLPRTVLMTLNPEAHAQLAILAGSFVEDGVPGKVQLGPAWWWCDHREGIFDVFEKTAAYGVLSTFIGMTTDSRSLLSFVRHDYFRRLFSRWLAEKVAAGDFPADEALLRPLAENVCFHNAARIV